MNILRKTLKLILITGCIICNAKLANAQAKNAIGIGLGLNYSRENSSGFGGIIQGEVKLARSISLVPSIGAEVPYVIYTGLAGRYYFTPIIYGLVGGFAHYNGDNGGLGGTAGIGFALIVARRQTFEINLHGDYMQNNHKNTPVAGLRLIYSFSFTRLTSE